MTINLSKCSEQERVFFDTILVPTLQKDALQFIYPQHEFIDSSERKRRIDFAIINHEAKIAIELDGYCYHAEGVISPAKFSDGLSRQNDLVLDGWKLLRFSWDDVCKFPAKCQDTLRKAIITFDSLHPFFASDVYPHVVQQEALDKLMLTRQNKYTRGLIVMPPGLGKTLLAAFDAKRMGGRVLFIVHNNSILSDARKEFKKIMPNRSFGYYNGLEKDCNADVTFANISTLSKDSHIQKFAPDHFDYIIWDEFHHAAGASYKKALNYYKPKFTLGLTATPHRTDLQPILKLLDNNIIYEIDANIAIERGFLVPFQYYGLKDNVDYSAIKHNGFRYDVLDLNNHLIIKLRDDAIVEKFKELAADARAIGFCVSIQHAKRAADHFTAAGIPSVAIHSELSNDKRSQIENQFRTGKFQVAFVKDIYNEGVNFPDVSALIFMRPTESKTIFIQQLGRGLRISPKKKFVKIFDFIGNYYKAEKVIDYLRGFGAETTLDRLRSKPIYHYDNGCEVNFEKHVVETLIRLNHAIIDQSGLLNNLVQVMLMLGRIPSIVELQDNGRFRIQDYIINFGTWEKFYKRVEQMLPDQDLTNLSWPQKLRSMNLDEIGSIVDQEIEFFLDTIKECGEKMILLNKAFTGLLEYERHGDRQYFIEDQIARTLNEIRCVNLCLVEINLVLLLRFPRSLEVVVNTPVPDELKAAYYKMAKCIAKLCSHRDAISITKNLASEVVILNIYIHDIENLLKASETERDELTIRVSSNMRKYQKRLLTIEKDLESVLSSLQNS